MGYISTEASNASAISSFSELSPNDKFILDKNGEARTCTLKEIQGVSGGITIRVSIPITGEVTCTDGVTTYKQTGSIVIFNIPNYGTWSLSYIKPNESTPETKTIVVDQMKKYEVTFSMTLGIQRNRSSSYSEWTRIDDSVGLESATSTGNVLGESDFDTIYPYSEMKRVTLPTGDVMVWIPPFYYKRTVDENELETIEIRKDPLEGFELHPGSGKYIGAYFATTEHPVGSVSGESIYRTDTNNFINSMMAKGLGWHLMRLDTLNAIQTLYLIEFADYSYGTYFGMGTATTSGVCDSVANLSGKNDQGVGIYRGIEAPSMKDIQQSVDGFCSVNKIFYIATDYSKNFTNITYGDTDCVALPGNISFSTRKAIAKLSYVEDHPWIMVPSDTSGGSIGGENSGYVITDYGIGGNNPITQRYPYHIGNVYYGPIFDAWLYYSIGGEQMYGLPTGRIEYDPKIVVS